MTIFIKTYVFYCLVAIWGHVHFIWDLICVSGSTMRTSGTDFGGCAGSSLFWKLYCQYCAGLRMNRALDLVAPSARCLSDLRIIIYV